MIEANERYPIERYIMTNNDCCKADRRRRPSGIQVHSVGCKGTTRERWRGWNVSGLKKCANAIVDLNGIMQTLEWDVRPWLSGSGAYGTANDTCVGFEICEPSASKDTPEAAAYLYGCTLYLCTELCKEYGIRPENIKCHAELHREGKASNHADVTHWWGKSGTSWAPYTMARLRYDVGRALGVELEDQHMTIMRKGAAGTAVYVLQMMLNALGYDCGVADGAYGVRTQDAVLRFQQANGLTQDGIAGPATQEKARTEYEKVKPEAEEAAPGSGAGGEDEQDPEADAGTAGVIEPGVDSGMITVDREDLYAVLKIVRELSGRLEAWVE